MSLRARIAVIAAVAVGVTVLAVSSGVYLATARTLHAAVDRALVTLAEDAVRGVAQPFAPGPRPGRLGGPGGFVQVIDRAGRVRGGSSAVTLPVSERARRLAAAGGDAFFETVAVEGVPVRILTVAAGQLGALQVARPIEEVEESLARLREQLAFGLLAGVVLAALLGTMVSRRAVQPVHELTELAEEVAATQDLSRRIAADGDDELGRLGRTINTMLANLEQARAAQEQLVADASHELRTPLTSLRTNIEVLTHADRLDEASRRDLIGDVVAQLDEFGRLVTGLVELARGARPVQAATALRLDEVVAGVVERARTFSPADTPIETRLRATTVMGEQDQVARAVANLVDNAVKYGAGAPVLVEVADGAVTVRDRGPGIADADLAHVFDRFYRAPAARSAPGSGLGLAIVRQVATAHGGTVEVANAPDGGALLTLRLPARPPSP